MLATGDRFGDVNLYDIPTRRRITTLHPTPEGTPIANLAFSRDSRRLAIAHDTPAAGNRVAIVDVPSGQVVRRIVPPRYRLATGLAWSGDNTLDIVVSTWPDQDAEPALLLRVDARTGRRLHGPSAVNRVGESPVLLTRDRRVMVTLGDGRATVRDARTLRPLRHLDALAAATSDGRFPAYALSPKGDTLALGAEDGSVRFVDVRTGRVVKASDRHGAAVTDARFSPDGHTLVTTGDDGHVIVWDAEHRTLAETLSGPPGAVFAPRFTPGGATLLTTAGDGTVYEWDLVGTRRLGRRFTAGTGDAARPQAALSSDGRLMAVGQDDGAISVVELPTLARRSPFPVVDTDNPSRVGTTPFGKVLGIGFVPGSHLLVVGGHGGFLAIVDADRGLIVRRLRGHSGLIWTPGTSADGSLLVTGSDDRTVRFWSLPDGRPLGRPLRFERAVSDAQLSPDGRFASVVILSSNNLVGSLQVWDVRSRRRVQGVDAQAGIEQARFSPDGHLLAVGTSDGRVQLWSTRTWTPVSRPFADGISEAISPDGRTLATGGTDGAVRLWDVRTRQALGAPLPGEPEQGAVPYFTADGRYLVASHETGRAYRWDIRPASLLRQACRVAGRQLTESEWQQFLPRHDYDPAC
jgi:WD40 repeat protein